MSIKKDYEGIDLEFYKNNFLTWSKQDEIDYNNNEVRYKGRYLFFQQLFDYIGANLVEGAYFEFGVHKARTFRIALSEARKKNIENMNFYAFDSFEGLPKASELDTFPGWEEGMLKTSCDVFDKLIQEHGLYLDKVHKIKGFYENSLTKELQAQMTASGEKVSIIYIDCDLYESAKVVLEFIVPFIQDGTVLCFDDWNLYKSHPDKGEKRAYREFKNKYEDMFWFEEFLPIGWMGKSFILNKK